MAISAQNPGTTRDFAQQIKQKYPTAVANDGRKYVDISDGELASMYINKYPVYKTWIIPSSKMDTSKLPVNKPGPLAKGIPGQVAQGIGNVLSAPAKVSQAVEGGIGKLASGAVNYAKTVGNDYMQGARDIESNVGRIVSAPSSGKNPVAEDVHGALGIGDAFAGAALAPLNEAIKPVAEAVGSATQSIQGRGNRQAQQQGMDLISSLIARHPDSAKDLQSIANIVMLVGAASGDTTDIGKNIGDTAGRVKAPLTAAADQVGDVAADLPGKVKGTVMGTPKDYNESAWETVKPKLNAKEMQEGIKSGDVVAEGKAGVPTQVPRGKTLEMLNTAEPYVKDAKNSIEATTNLKQGIADTATDLRDGLKGSTATWSRKNLVGALKKIDLPGLLTGDTGLNAAYENVMKFVLNIASKAPKTLDGLLDVKQALDRAADEEFPNMYSSERMAPAKRVILKARSAIDDQIVSQLPDGKTPSGVSYKDAMRKQTLLYDAMDNAAENTPKLGEPTQGIWYKIGKFAKKHPTLTNIGKIATGGAAYETAKKVGVPLP